MARVKAQTQIRLASGDVMTLAEALDRGLAHVWKGTGTSLKRQGERREITVYYAWDRDADGEVGKWTIGQKLYESRLTKSGKDPRE